MALTFPKSARLARTSEFFRVKTEGRSYSGRYMTLGVLKATGSTKAGLITSRRVGGAVVRNRVRRRLRELVRTTRPARVPGNWVVLIARRSAATASFLQLRDEWLRLAGRAGILIKPPPAANSIPPSGIEKSGAAGDTASIANL